MFSPWRLDSDWHKDDVHLKKYRRAAFHRDLPSLDAAPGVHTPLGPRRVGKSTLFKLWILDLIKRGISPEEISFLDGERFDTWKELLPLLEQDTAKFLFVDEITAVRDWTRVLKIMADEGRLEDRCVWITGSNAFDLKTLGERLPGRRGRDMKRRDMELLPLSFREFFEATQVKNGGDVRRAFHDFCLWGGYPMAISEYMERDRPSYDLLQELLDVVLGEVSRRHKSPRLTAALAERLYSVLGSRISYNALAKHVDAGSHPIIRQYIEILESCYSVIAVERLNPRSGTGILRKEKKIYFFDPLVAAVLVAWSRTGTLDPDWFARQMADPERQGPWVENMTAVELRKAGFQMFYDEQFGGEIDFVVKRAGCETWQAIEVKRTRPSPSELRPLSSYSHHEAWVL